MDDSLALSADLVKAFRYAQQVYDLAGETEPGLFKTQDEFYRFAEIFICKKLNDPAMALAIHLNRQDKYRFTSQLAYSRSMVDWEGLLFSLLVPSGTDTI